MAGRNQKVLTSEGGVVGHVELAGVDQYWVRGRFTPGPDYSRCAELFDLEREFGERARAEEGDDAAQAWDEALEKINALDLRLDGDRVRDFKVDGAGRCEFKFDRD